MTEKKETLSLLGAVYKRKWEHQANLDDLYKAMKYYEDAYKKYKIEDKGYSGINASYLYDVFASKVKKADEKYYQELHNKAQNLRKDIIKNFVDKKDKWLCHTLAQAYLGLGEFQNCKKVLEEATQTYEYSDREIFTAYKQLRVLANLKNIDDIECLLPLVGDKHLLEQSLDKKGLALSGGGFRASFFHLGMFAKLAECDMLKDIEVISTVSGGSIVGVHYYLKLQKLLEEKEDAMIEKEDYIKLVKELIDEFFEAVQTDIRNSIIFSSPLKTLKFLIPFNNYSRTNKLGEIYQERLYKKYKNYMSDLIITPKEWQEKDEEFKPRFNNWRRKNKVPILVINATNLNSGHNWQFQASKMGEPEYMANMEIDKNNRFDWVRYESNGLQEKYKNYPIGQAVACSSAVPMLFTPIVLKDLYDGYSLSMSDGGIYDNQGLSGLLSEECDYIICSDASGQMDNKMVSTTTIVGTGIRTTDIQMDRNREMIFEELYEKKKKGVLKGFLFTHLKKGLKSHEVKQEDVVQEFEDDDKKTFQEMIADVRTDLDSFSKTEAYALMYNGYELFGEELKDAEVCEANEDEHKWVFLKVKDSIDTNSKKLMDEMKLSKYMFTKRFRKWWWE